MKKGLKTRIIFNQDLRDRESVRFYMESPLTEVRFLPNVSLSSIGVQKSGTDMLIWTKDTALLFAIESSEIASTFRDHFNIIWKSARK